MSMKGLIFMIWVGILGPKKYFGEALSKLVAGHRSAQVSTMMDLQELCDGMPYMSRGNEPGAGYWKMVNAVKKSDIIFNGLPGAMAEEVYSKALSSGKRIIDIGDAYIGGSLEGRARSAYPGSVYGLSELYKDKMKDASIAANPSSYCTGAILGLAPLADADLIDLDTVAIESKSGITGLRRDDKLAEADITVNNGVKIYRMESRDYTEEVNGQMLTLFDKKTSASYTSYIIPGMKGITTTIKADSHTGISRHDISDVYRDFYKHNPFIEVCSGGGINKARNRYKKCFCKIEASTDADYREITVTTVLDDAVRGAASQAIQTMNLMYGIDGKIGL